jgi:tape measure domain-containing protein
MSDPIILLEFDDSKGLDGLQRIEEMLVKVGVEAKKTGHAIDDAFSNPQAAQGVADAVDSIKKEYADLAKSSKVLKDALKNTTDPTAIKLYSKAVADLEKGMGDLEKTAKVAGVNLKEANKQASTGKQVFEGLFGSFAKASLILEAIKLVKDFVVFAVSLSENTQKATRSFEAFLGSAEKAKGVVADLTGFAQQKLINTDDVFQAGKGLLAFGENADNLVPVLSRIADISAATGKNFNELVTIYGKARTSGVLYAEDINQLVDAGIPIIQEFAKQMGVSNDQVKKLASEGKISFEELQLAFFNLTKEGSKFAGQSELNALTLGGAWRGLVADISPAATKIGDAFKGAFQLAIFKARELIADVKELLGVSTAEQGAFFNIPVQPGAVDPEQARLEKEAAKRRAELAKKNAGDAAKLARELEQLRIEALKDGQAKEIALEDFRFKTLEAELQKHNIRTLEAETQHGKNIEKIRVKYFLERVLREQELLDAESESIKAGFTELEAAAKKLSDAETKRLEDNAARNLAAQQNAADLQKENFDAGLLAAREIFFQKKRTDKEIEDYDKNVAKLREVFQLQQQAAEIQRALDFDTKLSDAEKATLRKRLENIKTEIGQAAAGLGDKNGNDKPFSLFDLIGLDPNDPKAKAIAEAVQQVLSALNEISAARVRAAEVNRKAKEDEVKAAEDALKKEQDANEKGSASNIALRKLELAEAKKARDEALKEETKAKRAQIALDSVSQLSSLVVASANIFKALSSIPFVGVPLAIGTIALMFGAFAKAKADALKSVPKLRQGKRVEGRSHEAGGEDYTGVDGRRYEVENKEWIIGTKHSTEHDRFLSRLNAGEFQHIDLNKAVARGAHYENPLSVSVPRIQKIQELRQEQDDRMYFDALQRAVEKGSQAIVDTILSKPNIYPFKGGYIKETQTGNVRQKDVVLPQ